MQTDTIHRLVGATLAVVLLAAAAFFWTQEGEEQSMGLLTAALGIVALVTRSPLERRPRKEDDDLPPPAGLAGAALLLLALALAPLLHGCGGTPREQHATLNTVTDVADPTYEMALAGCDDARNAIIARAGTTYAQDRFAMDRVNAVCDAIVEGFEALRGSQITARAYIDQGLADAATAGVVEGLAMWGHLRALVARIATLGEEALEAVDADDVDPEAPPPVELGQTAGGEEAIQ